MSAEEPAEPKAVKHTLDAPGSPPAAKKARAEACGGGTTDH